MTEAEWLTSTDPGQMIHHLREPANARKLRLAACGCCRAVWDLLTDPRSRKALHKLEEYADDLGNDRLRRDAYNIANPAYHDAIDTAVVRADEGWEDGAWRAPCTVSCAASPDVLPALHGHFFKALNVLRGWDDATCSRFEADLVRDIFGNPFRPVAFSPAWRTDTAVTLARRMYDSREFSAMPILADALQDAGCDNEDVLNHCRGPGPHVRGCWVVDQVLGKE